jgi:ABC-type bacteriocin/lantibiotic exporter with double-glycine peptidase domain
MVYIKSFIFILILLNVLTMVLCRLMQTLPMMDGHPALIWKNARYLPNSGTSMCFPIQNTCLLNDSWGNFRYGRVTNVMGPPGCGKSTLLKVLGGKMDEGIFSGVHQRHILLGCLELVSEKVQL